MSAARTCPRCDATLSVYALAEANAAACDRCGYVGVEADHSGERVTSETWDDALRRFQNSTDS